MIERRCLGHPSCLVTLSSRSLAVNSLCLVVVFCRGHPRRIAQVTASVAVFCGHGGDMLLTASLKTRDIIPKVSFYLERLICYLRYPAGVAPAEYLK